MASTNKTPKLGLNQWAAGDEVRRTDFNADNAKLEAAVTRSSMVIGNFIGDNVPNRSFSLGFKPTLLMLFGRVGNNGSVGFSVEGHYFIVDYSGMSPRLYDSGAPFLTDSGFTIGGLDFNQANEPTTYIAFR